MTRKLSGPNHAAWAADIRQRLERLDLWDVVSEESVLGDGDASSVRLSPATRRQAERANRLIVESLEPHVLRDLLLTALPSNLWNVLELKFRDKAFGCVLEKVFEYFDARIGDPESPVEDHLASMQTRVDTMAAMGFTVSEDMQVMVLLRSLRGSRYAAFLEDTRRFPETPRLTDLVDQLKQFDATCPPHSDTKKLDDESKHSAASAELPWGSVSTASTASFASHGVSEEVMYAFARAVHSPSLDSSLGYESSTSSANTQPTQCWCSHKHHDTTI